MPESEEDEFLHWEVILDGSQAGDVSILALDPREFFENYESAETIFTVPDQNVTLIAHFTKRTKPVERGRFDYNATDFETVVTGEVGVTEHVWDLSEVEEGTTLDFYFHARVLQIDLVFIMVPGTIFYQCRNLEGGFESVGSARKP